MSEPIKGYFSPDEIRSMSLSGNNSAIRKLLISDQGRKVQQWVFDERQATTFQVMKEFKLSAQHASGILNKLYRQGYLRRHEQVQSSGGKEFVYYP